MNEIIVFSGSSHPDMAESIAHGMESTLGKITRMRYANNETLIELHESVRGADVFIVQTSCSDVNDLLMELLIMIHTCKISSASSITAVIPHFPYSRQDKMTESGRSPITAKLVANLISTAGADAILTMDFHSSQIQGFFDIPTENLSSLSAVAPWLYENIEDLPDAMLVSPDAGGTRRVAQLANYLQLPFAILHKERTKPNEVSNMILMGNVVGKTCIVVDDIVDTCGTMLLATEHLLSSGAKRVFGLAIHGILSGNAVDKVENSQIEKLVITNTIPQHFLKERSMSKFEVIDVSKIFRQSIYCINRKRSMSNLRSMVRYSPINYSSEKGTNIESDLQ